MRIAMRSVRLIALAVIVTLAGCSGSGGLAPPQGGALMPNLQPIVSTVPARVSFKVGDKIVSKEADKHGYVAIPVDDPAPSTVEVTLEHEGVTASAQAEIMEVADNPPPLPKSQWTLLVVLDGNNNLEEYARVNLDDLEAQGSTATVRVVALFSRGSEGGKGRILYIRKAEDVPETITHGVLLGRVVRDQQGVMQFVQSPKYSLLLKTLDHVDLASADTLQSFLAAAQAAYPAAHTGVIFSAHGGGYKNLRTTYRYVLYDALSGGLLTLPELAGVLGKMDPKPELIGFDACLMSMCEVAAALDGAVPSSGGYLVASPEATAAEGWPYGKLVAALSSGSPGPKEAAALAVKTYIGDYHARGVEDEVMAAVDLARVPDLVKAVDRLGASLLEADKSPAVATAVKQVRAASLAYSDPSFVDVGDFADRLGKGGIGGGVQTAAAGVLAALHAAVIAVDHTEGAVAATRGMSILFPADHSDAAAWKDADNHPYADLPFGKAAPQWTAFLGAFNQGLVPYLGGIDPDKVKAGAQVTLQGAFGKSPGTVTLNGAPVKVVGWKHDKVSVQIPDTASGGSLVVMVGDRRSNAVPCEVY